MASKHIEPVSIGGVPVGDGYPTVFVAEAGTFFNQDVALACSYLQAAQEAGAAILKTEILHDAEVCLKGTGLLHEYRHARGTATEDYRELIERKTVTLDGYREIFGYCKTLRLPVIASVYDLAGIDFLAQAGGAGIKIARTNINNVPLIRHAARTGLPVIIDAGGVYFEEVARAVRLVQSEGRGGVIVNHHPGANPAPAAAHHMRLMQVYKEALGVPVGLSCHYRGEEMLYVAVGLGANLLEKGVVDDPDRIEQDLVSATRLSDLKEVVQKVRNCWEALGSASAQPKEPRDLSTRQGLVAKCAIEAGQELTPENMRFAWPPLGISVEHWDLVTGGCAARPLQADEPIRWDDVQLRHG